MENNMNLGLAMRIRRLVFAADVSLQDWIEAVKEEDEFVAWECAMVKEMAKEMYRVEQWVTKSGGGCAMGTRIKNTTVARSTVSTSALPKLTPAKRSLIFDHQGCFKCRHLYINHKGANHPNGFPPPETYKMLTVEHAEAVWDSKNRPRTQAPSPVAHVGYSITLGARGPESGDYMLRTLRSLVKFTWLLISNNILGTFQM